MSLGIHSTVNGGKFPVDSASGKSTSGAEKVTSDDSSKFSKAIDEQVSSQRGNAGSAGHDVAQDLSEQFLLPDNSKGAQPADADNSVAHPNDGLDFIEDLLEHDASQSVELTKDNVCLLYTSPSPRDS